MKALGSKSIAALLVVFLDIATVLFWIALVCVVIAAIAYAGLLGLIAGGVLPDAVLEGGSGTVTRDGAVLRYDLDGELAWQRVLPALAAALVATGGGLIIVRRLKHLCANFRTGEPFRRENAEHLRVIWITMLVVETSRVALFAMTAAFATFVAPSPNIDWDFKFGVDLTSWGAILVLIILAEVFREGARLREDQDLTI